MSNNDNNSQDHITGDDPCRPYDPFNYNTFPFFTAPISTPAAAAYSSPLGLHALDHHHHHHHPHFDPSAAAGLISYTDCLHGGSDGVDHYNTLSRAFDMSCSDQPANPSGAGGQSVGTNDNNPSTTANSSISSSSNEATAAAAAAEEDSGKSKKLLSSSDQDHSVTNGKESDGDLEDKSSKKVTKAKKKEKRQREPRFSFLTKSDIDHLEDGYRWRKYGQKAVKNSPYPRSYYRCTTQKCTVKKRVERSFQDPEIVITTYEGQHNHHCPATLRGSAAMLSPSFFTSSAAAGGPALPTDFFTHLLPINVNYHQNNHSHGSSSNIINNIQGENSSMLYSSLAQYGQFRQPQLQVPDFGLLQDLVPPFGRLKQDQ